MTLTRLPPPIAAAAVALAGTATLAVAWGFEILGGYVPCPLCLEQRIPYYLAVPLAALVAVAAPRLRRPAPARAGLLVVAAIFAWGAWLGGYHAGAEWGWWPGPTDCAAAGPGGTLDAGSLLGELRTARVVRCDEAPWRLAGLSFAGWNVAISLGLAGLALAGAASRSYGSSTASQ